MREETVIGGAVMVTYCRYGRYSGRRKYCKYSRYARNSGESSSLPAARCCR